MRRSNGFRKNHSASDGARRRRHFAGEDRLWSAAQVPRPLMLLPFQDACARGKRVQGCHSACPGLYSFGGSARSPIRSMCLRIRGDCLCCVCTPFSRALGFFFAGRHAAGASLNVRGWGAGRSLWSEKKKRGTLCCVCASLSEPKAGLEPATYSLRMNCSTN